MTTPTAPLPAPEPRWLLEFGPMREEASIYFQRMAPNHQGLRLGDVEKRLGFFLTPTQAREWAKALIEAADAVEAQESKP